MSLAPGFSGPVHVCRRLFCEPTQALVQQTLETVIRRDQERFSKVWNFPPDVSVRQPLASKNLSLSNSENQPIQRTDSGVCSWRLFQPEAAFYNTPPRKLKAYRRLAPSVAQKTRMEMFRIPTLTISVPRKEESAVLPGEKCEKANSNSECNTPGLLVKAPVQTASAPTRPLTPILIRILIRPSPEDDLPPLPYLEHLSLSQHNCSSPAHSGHKVTVIRSRHSEQIKRRSGAKVTGMFKTTLFF
ncbi:unnamed protein product [Echinostoma caproni]|uniref:Testicular haploid expressed gene protein-like n=1 Tax=Echinostoma caproni TaxID=27848 RepID=A0A183ALD9_9TREM|nr:unnamed protein product [Echinostoma caproni]